MRLRLPVVLLFCLFAGIFGITYAQTTCPLSPQLTVGQRGVVLGTSPNNLRAGPTRNDQILTEIPGGGIFDVLAGPECDPDSGINWWQVDYAGQVGWTAEGDTSTYFVEPVHPALLYMSFEFDAPIGEDGRNDLVLLDLVTGESRNLTEDIPLNLTSEAVWRMWNFSWTPEGDQIAFTVEIYVPFLDSMDTSVYRMNADGSGKCLLAENAELMDAGSLAIRPALQQNEDGSPLDFPSCENPPEAALEGWRIEIDQQQAFAVNPETSERIQLTDRTLGSASYGGVISPDGTTAAINIMDANYDTTLYLIPMANPADAAPVVLSSEPTGGLNWSPDGQFLLVAGREGGAATLTRLNLATGAEEIFYTGNTAGLTLASPTYSPSGALIAFADGAEVAADLVEPRLFLMNADGSELHQLDTLATFGPILWRPE
jgi:hypothetical protein